MTGQEMIDEIQVRLQESLSTSALQQGMLYPRHVRRAADKVARDFFCLYATSTTDLIANQTSYEFPIRPFRFDRLRVDQGNGVITPIAGISPDAADSKFPNWTGQPPVLQGVPQFYVDAGSDTLALVPTPNYSVQDGIYTDGYFGVDQWWDMEDDCPLNEAYDEIIIVGALIRRCSEMMGTDPIYAVKKKDAQDPHNEDGYPALSRRHYRERIGRSEATRNAIPSRGKRLGAWSGWTVWGA